MKLWLVETDYFSYDEFSAFVIRAETETQARELACTQRDDHAKKFWLNIKKVTVTEITVEGEPKVILGSFHAG